MRLTPKKIVEILREILGDEGLPLINELQKGNNISEFDLATKTKKDIKLIRKMLYKLHNHNLVGFTRKKDKQKGWYIYYWTLLPESIRFNYFKAKRDLLAILQQQLESEFGMLFFSCQKGCGRLNFDEAMDYEFHCPECGELLQQEDSEKVREELRTQIASLQEEVSQLQELRQARQGKVRKRRAAVQKKVRKERKTRNVNAKGIKKVAINSPVKLIVKRIIPPHKKMGRKKNTKH